MDRSPLPCVSSVASRANTRNNDSSIGSLLLESGKISLEDTERVLRLQKESGVRFGEAAQRLGLINQADIDEILARQFDYPYLKTGTHNFSEELVAAYKPFSPQVETLRAVRSQLMLRWFRDSRKSLVVVGLDQDDGASVFLANLAVVFSQLGEQTLLVDGNLRSPSQNKLFNIKERQGLSDMLAGRAETDFITKVSSFVDLSVLGCGTLPPNPQELLSRDSFSILNRQFETKYDVVLYDVAGFSCGADAITVAARVGGALLVARRGSTKLKQLAAFGEQLRRSGVEIVGSVLHDSAIPPFLERTKSRG